MDFFGKPQNRYFLRVLRGFGVAFLASLRPTDRMVRVRFNASTSFLWISHALAPAFQPFSLPSPSRRRTQPSVQPAAAAASSTVIHSLSGDATAIILLI